MNNTSDFSYNGFNLNDKVLVSPKGHHIFCGLYEEKFNKVWTVVEIATGPDECLLSCEGVTQYMKTKYMTKVKEEKPMNITVKRIDVTDESNIFCAACGCVITDEEQYEFDGQTYCEDCIDDVAPICYHCEERHHMDEMTFIDGEWICEECRDDNYTQCDECGEWISDDDIHFVDGNYVCDDCVDNSWRYTRCERCGEIILSDESRCVYINDDQYESWCEDCYEWYTNYCEECDRAFDTHVRFRDGSCIYCVGEEQVCKNINEWKAPEGLQAYSYKPNPCFCPPEAEKDICYGFELEIDRKGYGSMDRYDVCNLINKKLGFTYCKRDGSLGDNTGIEIVSHPATLAWHMEHKDAFVELFEELRGMGYTSHDNKKCGLHVHISFKPLVEKNEHAVSNMLNLFDEHWDKIVRFSRRTSSQLEDWAKRYACKHLPAKDVAKIAKRETGRYMAVNLKNEFTVEIRVFRGTLIADTFFAALQFIQRIVDVCIACENPDDARKITWDEIVKSDYKELTEYCEKRFAADGGEALFNDGNSVELPNRGFDLSVEEMHLENLRFGDEIILPPRENTIEGYHNARGRIVREPETGRSIVHELLTPVTVFGAVRPVGSNTSSDADTVRRVNPQFRVGDYVRLAVDFDHYEDTDEFNDTPFDYTRSLNVGTIGIIRCDNSHWENLWGVEFDCDFDGHNLNRCIDNDRGQYIPASCLELI